MIVLMHSITFDGGGQGMLGKVVIHLKVKKNW